MKAYFIGPSAAQEQASDPNLDLLAPWINLLSRGKSPIDHRGTFVHLSVHLSVPSQSGFSGLKFALPDLKYVLSSLKSSLLGNGL